jgi:hypothetical protein
LRIHPARYAVSRHGFWAERGWVLLSFAAWLLFAYVTLLMPAPIDAHSGDGPLAFASRIASVLLGILALLAILMAGERALWTPPARWAMFTIGAALAFLPWIFQLNQPELKPLVAVGLLLMALPVGYWIGDRMEKVTNLIPLAVAMSLADIFSVYQGPTKEIAAQIGEYHERVNAAAAAGGADAVARLKAPLADFVLVHFPIVGFGTTSPVLGVGDFVILAFLYRAAWVHHISPTLMLVSSFLSIVVTLCVGYYFNMPLPALPFIAVGTLAGLWLKDARIRRLDRQEIVLSFAVVGIFGALIGAKLLRGLF